MLIPIKSTSTRFNKQHFVEGELLLKNQVVIQDCIGMPSSGSSYTHDIQMIFVKRGTFQLSYGAHTFNVSEKQIVLLKQNISVEYERGYSLTSKRVEFIHFHIKLDLLKEFMRFDSLAPALLNRRHAPDGFVKVKMLELLFHLSNMDRVTFSRLLDAYDHYRTNATSIVEKKITNAMSVNQLARLSGRSLSSSRRDFIAIYNMLPKKWIRPKRIEKEKQLLLSTIMTVTDICYTLGFENITFQDYSGPFVAIHRRAINLIAGLTS